MGSTLSTIILLIGSLVTGVLSSMAANFAREENYEKAKLYAGISTTVSLCLVLLTLFIIIRGRMTGLIAGPGILIALLVLLLSTFASAVLNIFSAVDSGKQDKANALKYAGTSAALCFGSFILSLILIIFLL